MGIFKWKQSVHAVLFNFADVGVTLEHGFFRANYGADKSTSWLRHPWGYVWLCLNISSPGALLDPWVVNEIFGGPAALSAVDSDPI